MWPLKAQVAAIVLPVKVNGSWILYQATRSGSQSVLKIAVGFIIVESKGTKDAQADFDSVFHALTKGAMGTWLSLLLQDPMSTT